MNDRLVPRDMEAEMQAVGMCLHDSALLSIVFAEARPEHFFDEFYRHLMLTIDGMVERKETVAVTSVTSQIIREWPQVSSLFPNVRAAVTDVYNAGWIANESVARGAAHYVRQAADKRKAIDILSRAVDALYEPTGDAQESIDGATQALGAISTDRVRSLSANTRQTLTGTPGRDGVASEILAFLDDPGAIRGIRTGWTMLDQWLSGLMRTKVYTLIADTSVGKSATIHWLAWMLGTNGYRSLIVSTEMDRNEILWRLVGMEASVDFEGIKSRGHAADHERERINRAFDTFDTENRYEFCDVGGIELGAMVSEVKRLVRRDPIDVVFVDHIQHIQVKGVPSHMTTQRLEAVTSGIKALAMNEDLPVVMVSHIPRSAAAAGYAGIHGGKGSSSIEQDSNVQLELTSVHWGVDLVTNERGWIPFASEPELLEFQNKTPRHPIRAQVNKNRHGGRPWDVRVRDWSQGGRLLAPTPEDMR